MSKTTKQKMLQDIKNDIYTQVTERWARIAPQDIEDHILRVIDNAAGEILLVSIGLRRSSWGSRWEVDHSHGRTSPILKEISERALQTLKEHMPALLDDLRKNRVVIKKELADEYRDCYKSHARSAIREYAVADADAEVKRLYKLIKAEVDSDNDEST